jgi:hypothetical protein
MKNKTYDQVRFNKRGINVKDRSDVFKRTKAKWAPTKMKMISIFNHDDNAYASFLVEDAARLKAHRAFLRKL